MSNHFPAAATMRTALALAIRAPSVHNVQPWNWRVGTESLQLYSDPTRHLVHTDPDGRDMMVSLRRGPQSLRRSVGRAGLAEQDSPVPQSSRAIAPGLHRSAPEPC